MNVAHLNPFIGAVTGLFQTTVKVPVKLGTVAIRQPDERLSKLYRISAVVELSGAVSGRVVICFAQPVAVTLAAAFLGRALPSDGGPDLHHALAAIARQIIDAAKSGLPNAEHIAVANPTVLLSSEVRVPPGPAILLPFDTPTGRLVLEICLVDASATAAPNATIALPARAKVTSGKTRAA